MDSLGQRYELEEEGEIKLYISDVLARVATYTRRASKGAYGGDEEADGDSLLCARHVGDLGGCDRL